MNRKARFYTYIINDKLRGEFPVIKRNIESSLKKKKYFSDLKIECLFEFHPFSQSSQWRIDIDFNDYEWNIDTVKPYVLSAFVSLEGVDSKESLHCNFGNIFSSFNDENDESDIIKVHYSKIDSFESLRIMKSKINKFTSNLEERMIEEIKLIDFNKLIAIDC